MCAINISVATYQVSLCYLYSGMRKKYGALPTYFDSAGTVQRTVSL